MVCAIGKIGPLRRPMLITDRQYQRLMKDYEKQRSVFVTTNLAFSEWDKVFKNPMTATAIVDRLVHRCVLLEFPAKRSIREDDAKKRQASV